MINLDGPDIFRGVLLDACTRDLVAQFPHLATLRSQALSGSRQALIALINQGDALAVTSDWYRDRRTLLGIAAA